MSWTGLPTLGRLVILLTLVLPVGVEAALLAQMVELREGVANEAEDPMWMLLVILILLMGLLLVSGQGIFGQKGNPNLKAQIEADLAEAQALEEAADERPMRLVGKVTRSVPEGLLVKATLDHAFRI